MTAPLSSKQFSAIAKALADPRRYGILSEIAAAGEQLPCSALKAACSVTAATISHHIKDLEAAGLIEIERDGKFAILRFRPDTLDAYLERLRSTLRSPLEQLSSNPQLDDCLIVESTSDGEQDGEVER